MMLGVTAIAPASLPSIDRGSSTSRSMWSPGKGVAVISVLPSAERARCHAPCGMTAIIPGAKRKRLGRPVIAHDFQGRGAVEDVDQLVAGEMAFPMVCPRGLDGQKEAVAVGSQSCDASLCLLPCRLGGPLEHCQLREFRTEIDDARHSAFHFSLPGLDTPTPSGGRRVES